MGSACYKPPDDKSYYEETDDFQENDFKIGQEKYPLKVHKGGRKALHKTKRIYKQIESDDKIQESLIQSYDQINQQHKSNLQKSTYSSTEKQIIAKENQRQLISIMKQHSSYKLIQSSQKAFSTPNSRLQLSSTKIRDQQEKHVRFKLPKSHKQKKRTHSKFRDRSNTQELSINL